MNHQTLTGKLIFAGDLEINGEKITGCALEIPHETLRSAEKIPLYQTCRIRPTSSTELCRIKLPIPITLVIHLANHFATENALMTEEDGHLVFYRFFL